MPEKNFKITITSFRYSAGSCIQQERDPISTECDVSVGHQDPYMNHSNTSHYFVDKREQMSTYTKNDAKPMNAYACEFCNRTFIYPSDLDVHTRMIHMKCRSLDCEVKLKKANEQGKVYECRFCSKQTGVILRVRQWEASD
jgi:hypothetical protein